MPREPSRHRKTIIRMIWLQDLRSSRAASQCCSLQPDPPIFHCAVPFGTTDGRSGLAMHSGTAMLIIDLVIADIHCLPQRSPSVQQGECNCSTHYRNEPYLVAQLLLDQLGRSPENLPRTKFIVDRTIKFLRETGFSTTRSLVVPSYSLASGWREFVNITRLATPERRDAFALVCLVVHLSITECQLD